MFLFQIEFTKSIERTLIEFLFENKQAYFRPR